MSILINSNQAYQNSSLDKFIKENQQLQQSFQELYKSLDVFHSSSIVHTYKKVFDTLPNHQKDIHKALETAARFNTTSSFYKAIQLTKFPILEQYSKNKMLIDDFSGILQYLNKYQYINNIALKNSIAKSSISNILNIELIKTETLAKYYTNTGKLNEVLKSLNYDFSNLEEIERDVEIIDEQILKVDDEEVSINEFSQEIQEKLIDNPVSDNLFDEMFKEYSPKVVNVLKAIIFTYIMGIIVNLTTPMIINEFEGLSDERLSKQNSIDRALTFLDEEDLTKNRIVTVHNLNVRTTCHHKAEIIDSLYSGKMVTLIEKNKAWSHIQYYNSENELINGWVFSRYLTKIKK